MQATSYWNAINTEQKLSTNVKLLMRLALLDNIFLIYQNSMFSLCQKKYEL